MADAGQILIARCSPFLAHPVPCLEHLKHRSLESAITKTHTSYGLAFKPYFPVSLV